MQKVCVPRRATVLSVTALGRAVSEGRKTLLLLLVIGQYCHTFSVLFLSFLLIVVIKSHNIL